MNKLLKTEEAAQVLGVSKRALENWRAEGLGPPYVVIGKHSVRYDPEDIKAYTKRNTVSQNE